MFLTYTQDTKGNLNMITSMYLKMLGLPRNIFIYLILVACANNCSSHGTCEKQDGTWRCVCTDGFMGAACEIGNIHCV